MMIHIFSRPSIIHGAMVDPNLKEDVTHNYILNFEINAQKFLGVVYFTDKWALNPDIKFPIEKAIMISKSGIVPNIRIQNSESPDGEPGTMGKFSHKNILDGKLDRQLRQYALNVKSLNTPVILEYGTEINGDWFCWSDDGPETFKKAFRYIVKLFQDEQVGNVQFSFHADATDNPPAKWYPGDDVVDWNGTSCYGVDTGGCFETLKNCYKDFTSYSKKKLAILEWGLADPADTQKTLEFLPKKFPKIKLLQYWNEGKDPSHPEDDVPDSRIDKTPEHLTAYRRGIAQSCYKDSFNS